MVLEAVKHLLFYSSYVSGFTFLNHNYQSLSGRAVRVICQKEVDGNTLNVVIEVHYISIKEYEITVKTAMSKEDFKLSDGQYAVEILNEDSSVLRKLQRGKIVEIYSI